MDVALDVLYPIRCLGCSAAGKFICSDCVETLPALRQPSCRICASPGVSGTCFWCRERHPAMDGTRSPYLYVRESPIHRAITALKYGSQRTIAPELAGLLARYQRRSRTSYDVIIPVPSHRSRVRQRGYSQAVLIAETLGPILGIPVAIDVLERIRDAPSQLDTDTRRERWNNVLNGFQASGDLTDKSVLLVDDLITTGSTASACASALKRAGAERVVALSVARAP